jgi:hypothetical protein
MKAITLYEPWASLMAIGAKVNETRPARTQHRGDICIHAAQRPMEAISPEVLAAYRNRAIPMIFHEGHIVAVAEIWEVRSADDFFRESLWNAAECESLVKQGMVGLTDEELSFGNYTPFRWIYRTRNLRRLKTPVKASGLQCVGWTVPESIAALVQAQLDSMGGAAAPPYRK